jgi:hypothetical protein
MNQTENDWNNLWKLFEELILQPQNKHAEIIAAADIQNKHQLIELNELLQAH